MRGQRVFVVHVDRIEFRAEQMHDGESVHDLSVGASVREQCSTPGSSQIHHFPGCQSSAGTAEGCVQYGGW